MARRPRSISWPDRMSLASLVWKLATPVGGSSGRSTLALPRGGSQAELPRQPQSVGDNVLPHNAPLTEVIDGNARHGRGLAGQRIVSARSPTVDHRIPFCDLLLDHDANVRRPCPYVASQVLDAFIRGDGLSRRRITELKGRRIDLVHHLDPSLSDEVLEHSASHCLVLHDWHNSPPPAHSDFHLLVSWAVCCCCDSPTLRPPADGRRRLGPCLGAAARHPQKPYANTSFWPARPFQPVVVMPSCCLNPPRSEQVRASTALPSRKRMRVMHATSPCLPVAGCSRNSPRLVPLNFQ